MDRDGKGWMDRDGKGWVMGVMCTVYCTVYCVLCNTPTSVIYLQQARKNHTPHTLTPSRTTPPPHAFARQHTHTHPPKHPNTQTEPATVHLNVDAKGRSTCDQFVLDLTGAFGMCKLCGAPKGAHSGVADVPRSSLRAAPHDLHAALQMRQPSMEEESGEGRANSGDAKAYVQGMARRRSTSRT